MLRSISVTTGTAGMVLVTAISSNVVKVSLAMMLVQQHVGEDDHDQRLDLQEPTDQQARGAPLW